MEVLSEDITRDLLVELKDGEVQTIFTRSSILEQTNDSEEKGLGNEKTSEEFVINLSSHLGDCKRVLNDLGSSC